MQQSREQVATRNIANEFLLFCLDSERSTNHFRFGEAVISSASHYLSTILQNSPLGRIIAMCIDTVFSYKMLAFRSRKVAVHPDTSAEILNQIACYIMLFFNDFSDTNLNTSYLNK